MLVKCVFQNSVVFYQNVQFIQPLDNAFERSFILDLNGMDMQALRQKQERLGVGFVDMLNKTVNIIAGGQIQFRHDLTVYGMLNDHVDHLSAVVYDCVQLILHFIIAMLHDNPSCHRLTVRFFQNIALVLRTDRISARTQKRDICNDDLTGHGELVCEAACADRLIAHLQYGYDFFSSLFAVHMLIPQKL